MTASEPAAVDADGPPLGPIPDNPPVELMPLRPVRRTLPAPPSEAHAGERACSRASPGGRRPPTTSCLWPALRPELKPLTNDERHHQIDPGFVRPTSVGFAAGHIPVQLKSGGVTMTLPIEAEPAASASNSSGADTGRRDRPPGPSGVARRRSPCGPRRRPWAWPVLPVVTATPVQRATSLTAVTGAGRCRHET